VAERQLTIEHSLYEDKSGEGIVQSEVVDQALDLLDKIAGLSEKEFTLKNIDIDVVIDGKRTQFSYYNYA